ncbi:hypothetical protein VNI00_009315 [Paramarasmius palmivorus]|uniref:Protein kinase domain-containing protein n=1 Tax=Paramarasmius palmivorus TaxID=297713 RepID=A0AAW0CNM7_9AGAR
MNLELESSPRSDVRYRRRCMKCLREMVKRYQQLPSCMILSDIFGVGRDPVGGGSYADIYQASMKGRTVCLKVIRIHTAGDSHQKQKLRSIFFQEALLWKHLRHPNVLPFLGANSSLFEERISLVTPWMANGDIVTYLRHNPEHDRLRSIVEIAAGLQYLHSQSVVHGDIKGANILVDDTLCCRLVDFGLAGIAAGSVDLGMSSGSNDTAKGTLRWMAPEAFNPCPGPVSEVHYPRDVYAFACTVYEIITGHVPFYEARETQVMFKIIQGDTPTRPTSQDIWCPNSVWDLACRCWEMDIRRRPTSEVVSFELEEIFASRNDTLRAGTQASNAASNGLHHRPELARIPSFGMEFIYPSHALVANENLLSSDDAFQQSMQPSETTPTPRDKDLPPTIGVWYYPYNPIPDPSESVTPLDMVGEYFYRNSSVLTAAANRFPPSHDDSDVMRDHLTCWGEDVLVELQASLVLTGASLDVLSVLHGFINGTATAFRCIVDVVNVHPVLREWQVMLLTMRAQEVVRLLFGLHCVNSEDLTQVWEEAPRVVQRLSSDLMEAADAVQDLVECLSDEREVELDRCRIQADRLLHHRVVLEHNFPILLPSFSVNHITHRNEHGSLAQGRNDLSLEQPMSMMQLSFRHADEHPVHDFLQFQPCYESENLAFEPDVPPEWLAQDFHSEPPPAPCLKHAPLPGSSESSISIQATMAPNPLRNTIQLTQLSPWLAKRHAFLQKSSVPTSSGSSSHITFRLHSTLKEKLWYDGLDLADPRFVENLYGGDFPLSSFGDQPATDPVVPRLRLVCRNHPIDIDPGVGAPGLLQLYVTAQDVLLGLYQYFGRDASLHEVLEQDVPEMSRAFRWRLQLLKGTTRVFDGADRLKNVDNLAGMTRIKGTISELDNMDPQIQIITEMSTLKPRYSSKGSRTARR